MRSRTIRDCERDVKGIHSWIDVPYSRGVFWCHECGALGDEQIGRDGIVKSGTARFKILRRVQE